MAYSLSLLSKSQILGWAERVLRVAWTEGLSEWRKLTFVFGESVFKSPRNSPSQEGVRTLTPVKEISMAEGSFSK